MATGAPTGDICVSDDTIKLFSTQKKLNTQLEPHADDAGKKKWCWRLVFPVLKGCRMGRSYKVSLWYVALLINTRFRFFI